MEKVKTLITILGLGITIGVVLVVFLVFVVGAKPKNINVGGIEFEFPTATPISPSNTNIQAVSTPTTIAVNPKLSQIAPVVINDVTNKNTYSYNFPPVANNPSSCVGAYLETGMTTIDYQLDVPNSWVVIIDSWKAEWSSGDYQNNGIVIITGEWQGNVKVNIGAICIVPANLLQSNLEIRRNLTKNDGRPEYTIP